MKDLSFAGLYCIVGPARVTPLVVVLLLAFFAGSTVPVQAQGDGATDGSFTLEESTINGGGAPTGGAQLSSASFRLSPASIGDAVQAGRIASASWVLDGGFSAGYAAPGEVRRLRLPNDDTLTWIASPAAGTYNLYRDTVSSLDGLGFGQCTQQSLTNTTATDTDPVPQGDAYFYLVTVVNRLGDEGTKGFSSDESERAGAACP